MSDMGEFQINRGGDNVVQLPVDATIWAEDHLADLGDAVYALKSEPGDQGPYLEKIFGLTREMKVHGEIFGYGIVAEIADLLGRFVVRIDQAGADEFVVVEAHLDALKIVVLNGMRGDGGNLGRELIASLHTVRNKAAA